MKQKCKGGWEWDMVTSWRKVTNCKWSYVKRGMNKRFRKEGKDDLRKDETITITRYMDPFD